MALPFYDLKSFKTLCGTTSKHKNISINVDVLKDALLFNLTKKSDILYCIDEAPIDGFKVDICTEHRHIKDAKIFIDSYIFKIDHKECYLAFFYDSRKGQWFIKSFHPPEKSGKEIENKQLQKALKGMGQA